MSDIVERLLRFRPVYGWPEEKSTVVEKSLNQVAVDEITRLRAELAAVTAERDRMRDALKVGVQFIGATDDVIEELNAENEKLLGSLNDVISAVHSTRASIGVACIDIQVIDRARDAIEGVTENKS